MKIESSLIFLLILMNLQGLDAQIDSISKGKKWARYKFDSMQKDILKKHAQIDGLRIEIVKEGELIKGQVVNYGNENRLILTQDGSLIIIAEALRKEKWRPIEYWIWSDCGNSYSNPLELRAGKLIEVEVPEYIGNRKSKMRLKMCTGEKIIYSNEISVSLSDQLFNDLSPRIKNNHKWMGNFFLDECGNQLKEVKETIEEMEMISKILKRENKN